MGAIEGWTTDMYSAYFRYEPRHQNLTTSLSSPWDNDIHAIDPPPLDIAVMGSGSFFTRSQGRFFNRTIIQQRSICQPENKYYWGFSHQLTFAFLVTSLTLASLTYLVLLRGLCKTDEEHADAVFGDLRTSLVVSKAMRESLGEGCDGMSNEELTKFMEVEGRGVILPDKRHAAELAEVQLLQVPESESSGLITAPSLARYRPSSET